MFSHIPHASFPFDESPWVAHFRDAAEASRRSQLHLAAGADAQGHDYLARHILAQADGVNPLANYQGPFGEGQEGNQIVDHPAPALYQEYFSGYAPPGGLPGMGPFADPTQRIAPGAIRPGGYQGKPPGSI